MSSQRVSIDLREADIQNVLRLIAKQGGVNVIAGSDVGGTVTMRLRSVPLDEVFLTVLQAQGLGFEVRSNVIRVAPQETLAKEEQARTLAAAEKRRQDPLEVFLIPVNYATAGDLVPQIRGLLSSRGSVQVDERTNTLIIKDIEQNLASIKALVENLDTQVPQVLIEARIVETTDTFNQQIGIQWGGDLSFSQANGNPTGLIFPSVLGVGGAAQDQQTQAAGTSSNPNFAVNLPAPIGTRLRWWYRPDAGQPRRSVQPQSAPVGARGLRPRQDRQLSEDPDARQPRGQHLAGNQHPDQRGQRGPASRQSSSTRRSS